MRIAFVTPPVGGGVILVADLLHGCWCQGDRVGGLRLPPLPQLLLATIAAREGHEVTLVDAPNQGLDTGAALLGVEGWDLLVLHVSTPSLTSDLDFVRQARARHPGLAIAAYGAEPTFRPDLLRSTGLFTHLIAGSPEQEFAHLLAPAVKPRYCTMEELPPIDTELLPPDARYFNPIGSRRRFMTLVTSRGCPGRCSFCTVPAFHGRRYDAMSGARVAAEVAALRVRGFREVFFRDENFTTSRPRVVDFCERLLGDPGPVPFIISSRVDLVDHELLRLLRRAGCRYIRYGVESGSDAVLKSVGKGTSQEMIEQTFRLTAAAGIKTHAHFVAGLPAESAADREATRRLIMRIRPDTLTIGLFTPLPGSALYPDGNPGGAATFLDPKRLHLQASPVAGRSPEARREIEAFPRALYREYYLSPRYLLHALAGCRSLEELLIKMRSAVGVLRFGARR